MYVLIVVDESRFGLGIKGVEIWCRKKIDLGEEWEEIEPERVSGFDVEALIEEELRGKIWMLDRPELEEVWYLVEVKCEKVKDED